MEALALRFLPLILIVVWYSHVPVANGEARACVPRRFDHDTIVCVCNSSYCDAVGPEATAPFKQYNAFISSRSGLRMSKTSGSFNSEITPSLFHYKIGNTTRQTILGFGGAFTDAASINVHALSASSRSNLINSYFEENGIEYTIGRIPIASCDFSKRVYSYDDNPGDLNLSKFTLVEEDVLLKIPFIKEAIKVSKRNVSLFGSPWSSPFWMKTNNNMTGKGTIKGQPGGEYFKAWANYFVKFVQAYKQQGVDIWGLTAQNEPTDGLITDFSFQCLGWTPELQRDFIAKDLGPALESAGLGHIKLMILDDQRVFLPYWAEVVLKDPSAAKYVSGIAVHWYEDLIVPTLSLDVTYSEFGADYFMLNTEACEQDLFNKNNSVQLGNWYRGERYFRDMLQDLKHGVSGWVDWNMALDMGGGPNWENNKADSPIIVNAAKDEFYKQPMFYAMGHFSKFVRPGSKVIEYSANIPKNSNIDAQFYLRDDNTMAANIINYDTFLSRTVTIDDPLVPGLLSYEVPARSFVTIVWSRK